MDNTENGTPAPRRFVANQTQDHEERIQALEAQVQMLTMLAQHHIKMIGRLYDKGDGK